ncbi:MAG: carbohydrate kinase [Fuerstiella sp.]|nr:carbohydrate kinase [Fuerstiella sp.]
MSSSLSSIVPPLVIGLGEILWDVFPDGRRFGGAPANFACCAARLGANSVTAGMVSAVGRDDPGRQALQRLTERGVNIEGVVQTEDPTGRVDVSLDESAVATYTFAPNTAWDALLWNPTLAELARRTRAVSFGTLCQRSELSRQTITRFLKSTHEDCIRILDVNLRPPYWSEQMILQSLELASVLKCNDEELPVLGSLLECSGNETEVLRTLMSHWKLRLAVLTRGRAGSIIIDSAGQVSERPAESASVVDTVGAGDAFGAAVAIGMLNQVPLPQLHEWAGQVASFVCSESGATPSIPASLTFANQYPATDTGR